MTTRNLETDETGFLLVVLVKDFTFIAMLPISVVVITKNEARNIERCLMPWKGVCNELLIVDNGSSDQTIALAKNLGATVYETSWKGYGTTKNEGNRVAVNPWILSLDADEVANPDLVKSLQALFQQTPSPNTVFAIRRKLVIQDLQMKYGSSKREYRIRLFHRDQVSWNSSPVHEDLHLPASVQLKKLSGFVWHYSFANFNDQAKKLEHYAKLSAEGMFQRKKKVSFLKKYLSSFTVFFKNYLLRMGFLDGKTGWKQVSQEMRYAFNKYLFLEKMYKS